MVSSQGVFSSSQHVLERSVSFSGRLYIQNLQSKVQEEAITSKDSSV